MKAVVLGMELWVSGILDTILPASCIPNLTSILLHILLAGLGHATKNIPGLTAIHQVWGEVTHQILPAASSTVPCPPAHPSMGNGDCYHGCCCLSQYRNDSHGSQRQPVCGALGCWFSVLLCSTFESTSTLQTTSTSTFIIKREETVRKRFVSMGRHHTSSNGGAWTPGISSGLGSHNYKTGRQSPVARHTYRHLNLSTLPTSKTPMLGGRNYTRLFRFAVGLPTHSEPRKISSAARFIRCRRPRMGGRRQAASTNSSADRDETSASI